MNGDPILDELHAIREEILAEYNGDVHAYVQDARERALKSGRPIAVPKDRTGSSARAADRADAPVDGGSKNHEEDGGEQSRMFRQ